jgi:chromate transport protein ChrA
MWEVLFWVYLANAVLLITHEIDSAYWQEWKLFRLPGGHALFLLLHLPLLFLVLYGLVLVYRQTMTGLVASLLLSLAGLFAFAIHAYFLRKGRDEFKLPISLLILVATLFVSLLQVALTFLLVAGN